MSVKMGFLSSSSSDMQTVEIVKQDIPRESFFNAMRSGQGDLQSVIYSEKANIHLELDRLTTSELSGIRKVMSNRVYPHKLFMQHPATNQEYTFDTTDNKCYNEDDDSPDYKTLTNEFTSQKYIDINVFDTNFVSLSTIDDYTYLFFTADISDFITAQGSESLTRITLALKNLFLQDGDSSGNIGVGFQIAYFDASLDDYVEIKRSGITLDSDNTIYASVRPIDNFSNFDNALVGNTVKFRVRNLYARRSGSIAMQVDFAKIFVNGYGCVWNNEDNFTYRDTFTGAGWTGNMDLLEL